MTLTEILGERASALKQKGEETTMYGICTADMTRDELLMTIGWAVEYQLWQLEQHKQEWAFMREITTTPPQS